MAGPIDIVTVSYWNDVQMIQHRAVVLGTDEQHITLPSGNDPYPPPVGIARDGNAIGKQEAVREHGRDWCEAAGTCTAGKPARVMANGLVQDAILGSAQAPPVDATQQTIIGYFRTSGVAGDLVIVDIAPGTIYQ